MHIVQNLTRHHHLLLTVIEVRTVVIEVGKDVQTVLVVRISRSAIERENSIVEVQHIGVILIDALQYTVLELLHVFHRWRTHTIAPSPLVMDGSPIAPIRAMCMVLSIEFLGVKTVPPVFERAVRIGCQTILLRQFHIVVPTNLEERPGMSAMHGNSDLQSMLSTGFCPTAYDIFHGAYPGTVPLLIRAVPTVEVVMMLPHCHEVFSPSIGIKLYESFGVPLIGFPVVTQVFISQRFAGRSTENRAEGVPLMAILSIHGTCVPIAIFCLALWVPVCPDTELGIAEPLRTFPCRKALPITMICTLLNGHILQLSVKICGCEKQ